MMTATMPARMPSTMWTTCPQPLHAGGEGPCTSWAHLCEDKPAATWWVVVELAETVHYVVNVCDGCARAMVEAGSAWAGNDGGPGVEQG
ncbi:MAG: hypothetical protein QG597_1112 [Actinomycetota bacterium]|nr:hypothetical protein [Actinomycetota bacterium]